MSKEDEKANDKETLTLNTNPLLTTTSLNNCTDVELDRRVYDYLMSTSERTTEQFIIIELYKRLYSTEMK